jgi:hypothetical protein
MWHEKTGRRGGDKMDKNEHVQFEAKTRPILLSQADKNVCISLLEICSVSII